MTTEETTTKAPSERLLSLNWLIFGVALVALVVFLIVVAMDRDNVVWENGKAWCPHCRLEVPSYSTKCPTCGEKYDWTTYERLCHLCLAKSDVEWIQSIPAEELEKSVRAALPGDDAQVNAVLEWLEKIGRGECVYCAGTGIDLFTPAQEGVARKPCPVCFGDGECVLCDGREKVRIGNLGAHQDLLRYRESLAYHEGRLGQPTEETLQEAVESAVGELQGYDEVSWIDGTDGTGIVNRAEEMRLRILKLLPKKPAE